MSFSDVGSTMSTRPDRPLIVKAAFERTRKRIIFASARNCTYDLLRCKVEQSFSLQAFQFNIAYEDDDGEVTNITGESDLTEAIQYFRTGVDDMPVSSAQSILSGRSFASRKITLRVSISVEYDGPSLSDTSSLASMEEYTRRNGSGSSFSLSLAGASQVEPEDDSVTVSSRDTGQIVLKTRTVQLQPPDANGSTVHDYRSVSGVESIAGQTEFSDRYPPNPSAVFERLKLSESDEPNGRNHQWLREQSSRARNGYRLSESSFNSFSVDHTEDGEVPSPLDGDLALQQDNGRFYYTLTSSSVSSSASTTHDDISINEHGDDRGAADCSSLNLQWIVSQQTAATQSKEKEKDLETRGMQSTSSISSNRASCSTFPPTPSSSSSDARMLQGEGIAMSGSMDGQIAADIPPEVLKFVHANDKLENPPLPEKCTDCSACGAILDAFRYVCSTCGEKSAKPRRASGSAWLGGQNGGGPWTDSGYATDNDRGEKGKAREDVSMFDPLATPSGRKKAPPLPPRTRPLPTLPTAQINGVPSGAHAASLSASASGYLSMPSFSSSSTTLAGSVMAPETGYELCPSCIECAGVLHAVAGGAAVSADETSSPEVLQALSQLYRTAPKQKGSFRHAFLEKQWTVSGWTDVEQSSVNECKICKLALGSQRYKCASCDTFVLCRACYSQVHEIHPSHAFFDITPNNRSKSETEEANGLSDDGLGGDESLVHPGVKCVHCLMDIVGARFHCAICESVDICSNCESAGLPGNLDADNGGHDSSHIMLKIPFPLNTNKVQSASRRARQLWRGRDSIYLSGGSTAGFSQEADMDATTVIGAGPRQAYDGRSNGQVQGPLDHGIHCRGCGQGIVGTRFQCAYCPALGSRSHSLCVDCEQRSYLLHDPMHVFFKLTRPVDRPIESRAPLIPILYKMPAGPQTNLPLNSTHPKAYLSTLYHIAALCDHCMERIKGEWFRCAYCAKDLCDVCEGLGAHDNTHVFYVFKAPVDMQKFRSVARLDDPNGSPPVLTYPVYFS